MEEALNYEKMLYKLPDENIIPIPRKHRLIASELLFK